MENLKARISAIAARKIKEERYNKLSEAFGLFNKDNNGLITLAEVGKVMRSLGQNPTQEKLKEQLKEAIAVLDADENFVVGFLEFFNFMAPKMEDGGTEEELIKAFNNFGQGIKPYLDNETHDLPIRLLPNVAESIVGYFPNNAEEWIISFYPYEFPDEGAITLCSSWNVPCKLYSQVNDWVLFKLASKEDRDTVLSNGRTHKVYGRVIPLSPMPVFFNLYNSDTEGCWTDPCWITYNCPNPTKLLLSYLTFGRVAIKMNKALRRHCESRVMT